MTTERTITLCGKQVKMRYCAATEIGFETLTGKSSAIFVPEVIKDKKGKIKEVKQHATLSDFTNLAIAGAEGESERISHFIYSHSVMLSFHIVPAPNIVSY